MMDDPDARLERAEPARGPLLQACARRFSSKHEGTYHDELEPEHVDHLLVTIGEGLALCEVSESASPAKTLRAMVTFIEQARRGKRRTPREPDDAVLALACLYGHQLCRDWGWGWAYLRRARPSGIVLLSPGFRYVIGARQQIDKALDEGGDALLRVHARLRALTQASKNHDDALYVRA